MELKNLVIYGLVTFTVAILVAVIVCACLLIARPGLFTGAGLPNHRTCGESPSYDVSYCNYNVWLERIICS